MKLQFVRGGDLASSAIGWFSAGHLSHVDAILADGGLLGARSDSIGGKPPGVQIRPPGYAYWPLRVVYDIPSTAAQEQQFWTFLYQQIGKPYDKLAIMAFLFNRNWRDGDAWFCSELQARALECAGILKPSLLPANKVTPVMLAELVGEIGSISEMGLH